MKTLINIQEQAAQQRFEPITRIIMKKIVLFWILIIISITPSLANQKIIDHPPTKAMQQQILPAQVLAQLEAGNVRFLQKIRIHRDPELELKAAVKGQHPYAVILTCMDSRNIPEVTFDQGIGEIFVIRVAGNVLSDDVLASLEYATAIAGAKLIVVLGHTSCGAVAGACEGIKLGHLTELVEKIKPAIKVASQQTHTRDCKNKAFIDDIAKQNVFQVIHGIKAHTPLVAKLINQGKIGIVGAMYNVGTGKVTFYKDHI